MKLNLTSFATKDQIAEQIEIMAKDISKTYGGQHLVVLGVLTGALFFMKDLIDKLTVPLEIDFVKVKSYVNNTKTENILQLAPSINLTGKNVLIVDDICDTGSTLAEIKNLLVQHKPKEIKTAVCIDRISDYKSFVPDYSLFQYELAHWFVGYGLDLDGLYREFKDIYIVDKYA